MLILFDIDGTLLRGGRRLRQWFGESLESVYGQDQTHGFISIYIHGNTSPENQWQVKIICFQR